MRIMVEDARDRAGIVIGVSLSTDMAQIDVRRDGAFFLQAHPLLEVEDLEALRALIDAALARRTYGSCKV